jgi:hypothetical protein
MVAVGWLVEGKGVDGRPFVSFPKWENWLSKSAKARLQNSMNQRNARQLKALEDQPPEPKRIGVVVDLSLSDRDKTVTTVQKSTVQESIQEIPPLSPKGETAVDPSKGSTEQPPAADPPPKRKPKETVGEFLVPPRLDSPEVREALEAFERMRRNIGHPIRDRGNVCRGWDQAYRDRDHLLACINLTTANEWQGIKPSHIDPRSQPAMDPKRKPLEVRPERHFR